MKSYRTDRIGSVLVNCLLLGTLIGCNGPDGKSTKTLDEMIASATNISQGYPKPIQGDASSFGKYFLLEGQIQLSDEILIGSISQLDVDYERGKLLVTDRIGHSVLLYRHSGEFLKVLGPEDCRPGTTWRPRSALFKKDGSIAVINAGAGIFYFDDTGRCTDAFMEYLPPRFVDYDSENQIWGIRSRADHYVVEVASASGELKGEIMRGTAFRGLMSRVASGGLKVDRIGNVFIALPFDPAVYKYDIKSNFIEAVGPKPSYYRALNDDLLDSQNIDGREAVQKILEMMRSKTQTIGLLMLDDHTLLAIYLNKYNLATDREEIIGINVFSTDGRPLISEEIQTSGKNILAAASNGFVYAIEQQTSGSRSADSNPSILVYRFISDM